MHRTASSNPPPPQAKMVQPQTLVVSRLRNSTKVLKLVKAMRLESKRKCDLGEVGAVGGALLPALGRYHSRLLTVRWHLRSGGQGCCLGSCPLPDVHYGMLDIL